jgi:thioredoxin 1
MAALHVNKDNFDELVLNADCPVLVDFFATWCGPCKMIAPIVEEIAAERDDIIVGKIDVDQEMELAMQFGITSIPTLVLMKNGEVAATMVGYRPKADILKLLNA